MTPEEREGIDEILSRDAPPYQPKPGDRSLLSGIGGWPMTREQALSLPLRATTLAWMASILAPAAGRPFEVALSALIDAIPNGDEAMLDNDSDYIFAFDTAAFAFGIDPYAVSFRPEQLDS